MHISLGFLTCLYAGTFWGERNGQERATGEVGWVARTRVGKGQERGKALAKFGQRMRKREQRQEGTDWWHFKTVRKKLAVVSKASMCPGQPGCAGFSGVQWGGQCSLQDLGKGRVAEVSAGLCSFRLFSEGCVVAPVQASVLSFYLLLL